MTPPPAKLQPAQTSIGKSAFLVASGIFLSRISGLIFNRVLGHFFGLADEADAYRAAFKIPNILQNMFGEGALSASFIPVYARLLAEGKKEDADRVAGAVFSLVALVTSVLVLIGVLAAPWLIDVIAPGFHDPLRRNLTIHLVRIFFPAIGFLVLSAWCLGILNSHRKFFLSYVSPVIVNAATVTALLIYGRRSDLPHLAAITAWAAVVGSALQFVAQLSVVLRIAQGIKLFFLAITENVRVVLRNFVPTFVARGVNQLSAYIDQIIASYLPHSAVAALSNAQLLGLLPVSLFGMSVSAAELPAMSGTLGDEGEIGARLRERIAASTRRIGFFVVPSAIAFLALGDVVAGAIFQTGAFNRGDTVLVWEILAGSAIGLVAATVGRLYSSAYYALRDPRTPLKFAVVRVALTTGLGYLCALRFPQWFGVNPLWGTAGLTASAGFSAWVEFLLLRRGMNRRIGHTDFPVVYFTKLWISAIIAAAGAWGLRLLFHPRDPILTGVVILIPYGLIYLGSAAIFGIDEVSTLYRRLRARVAG